MDIPDTKQAEQEHECSLRAQYGNYRKKMSSIYAKDVEQWLQKA
ncbi:hypothetical protein [Undibacterium sp. GrIS 1.8]